MRIHTQIEKDILLQISQVYSDKEIRSFNYGELIAKKVLIGICILKIGKRLDNSFYLDFYIDLSKKKEFTSKQKQIENDILNHLFFLKDLCDNGLLHEVQNSALESFVIPEIGICNKYRIESNFDKLACSLIVRQLNVRYFISNELIDFVDRGFCSEDTKRYKNQTLIAWVGIVISFIVGLSSLIISIISLNSPTDLPIKTINNINQIIQKTHNVFENTNQIEKYKTDSLDIKAKKGKKGRLKN